ncbi:hypothetical protein QFZ80_007802 [Paenibacillus sp. V4I7]|nr:hypothetical protein [Paenibacillus sp. V4I7]
MSLVNCIQQFTRDIPRKLKLVIIVVDFILVEKEPETGVFC